MGVSSSVQLPPALETIQHWSGDKIKTVVSRFFNENFGYSLTIYHTCKLTGLETREAKELRSILSDKRVNNVNGVTLLIVMILLSSDLDLHDRQEMLFKLVDFKRIGELSAEALEILLYRVSLALSRVLQTDVVKSSHVKHLRKVIMKEYCRAANEQDEKVSGENITFDEYFNWSNEVLYGGKVDNKKKDLEVLNSCTTIETLNRYFHSYFDIFEDASVTLSKELHNLEAKPTHDDEVQRIKSLTQHEAGVKIEALTRYHRRQYMTYTVIKKRVLLKTRAVELVKDAAIEISSTCDFRCLKKYHDITASKLKELNGDLDRCRLQYETDESSMKKLRQHIENVKLQRSLLSQKMAVLSDELQACGYENSQLQQQIIEVQGHPSNFDKTMHTPEHVKEKDPDVVLLRYQAQQEIITRNMARLNVLRDDCCSQSADLMNDDIECEIRLKQHIHDLEKMKFNIKNRDASKNAVENKLNHIKMVIKNEFDYDIGEELRLKQQQAASYVSQALMKCVLKSCAQQYSTLIGVVCNKVTLAKDLNNLTNKKERIESLLQETREKLDTELVKSCKLDDEIVTMNDELNNVRGVIEQHRNECRNLETKLTHLKSQEEALQIAIEAKQEEMRDLEIKHENGEKIFQEDHKKLMNELSLTKSKMFEYEQQAEAKELLINKIRHEHEEKVTSLENELEATHHQAENIVEMTENMISENNQEVAKFRHERDVAQQEVRDCEEIIKKLEEEVKALKHVNDNLSNNFDEIQNINDDVDSHDENIIPPSEDGSNEDEVMNSSVLMDVTSSDCDSEEQNSSDVFSEHRNIEIAQDNRGKDDFNHSLNKSLYSSMTDSPRSEVHIDPTKIWEVCKDNNGEIFYFNKLTEESTWTKPDDLDKKVSRKRCNILDEDCDYVSFDGKQLQRIVSNGNIDEYWINVDTGSVLENAHARCSSRRTSSSIINVVENQSDSLSEGNAAAKRIQAEKSVLDEREDVDWSQLLIEATPAAKAIIPNGEKNHQKSSEDEKCDVSNNEQTDQKNFKESEVLTYDRSEWELCHDDDGQTFYYNKITDESTWTRPEDLDERIFGSKDNDEGCTSMRSAINQDHDYKSVGGRRYSRLYDTDGSAYWMNDDTGSLCDIQLT